MGKRGMFFSLYLTVITLVMAGVVIGLYLYQQGNVSAAVISPVVVLDVRDNLSLFELKEQELILDSLESVSGDFGSLGFRNSFRDKFLSGLSRDMKEFLLYNLYYDGKRVEDLSDDAKKSFFENVVYPESKLKFERGRIIFERGEVGKVGVLRAGGNKDIRFDVDYVFRFDKKYYISKVGNGFMLEEE